jgi:hypothetical protein
MRLGILVALLSVACATSSSKSAKTEQGTDRHDRNVITREELAATQARTVYDAIRQLRPSFLQPHRTSATSGSAILPAVYIDGTPLGEGLGVLRQMRPDDVLEIRFLSAADATQRFGTGNAGGAILVQTKH